MFKRILALSAFARIADQIRDQVSSLNLDYENSVNNETWATWQLLKKWVRRVIFTTKGDHETSRRNNPSSYNACSSSDFPDFQEVLERGKYYTSNDLRQKQNSGNI